MKQDPRYLRNRSRQLHALYRRRRFWLNVFTPVWGAFFLVLFVLALIDRSAGLGWGLASQLWPFLGFTAFAPVFWVISVAIYKLNLAYIRQTYGPDPGGPLER